MSEITTNYQLIKLDNADISTIIAMNGNPDKIDAALKMNQDAQQAHNENKNNPHEVTKAQVGLGNVDNTTDLEKPVSIPQQKALNGKADLDTDGKIPAVQLPSYVDDVLEFNSKGTFPEVGEAGKIYVAADTNLTYRWTGTTYVEISPSLALGTTSSTAYRGDWGEKNKTDIAALMERIEKLESGQYPVGSIFMTTDNRNPSAYLGGTWVEWGAGRVPVGVDTEDSNFNTAEKAAGSKDAVVISHSHTQNNHTHYASGGTHLGFCTFTRGSDTGRLKVSTASGTRYAHVGNEGAPNADASGINWSGALTSNAGTNNATGVAGTGKNLQPYITCYMWKRTA